MNIFKTNGDKNITNGLINGNLGVSDKKNHSTFYFEGKFFIEPSNSEIVCKDAIDETESKLREFIKKELSKKDNFEKNFIINIETCPDRMKEEKKSYFTFQYYFKQDKKCTKGILDVKKENKDFFIDILDNICEVLTNCGFNVHKSKN